MAKIAIIQAKSNSWVDSLQRTLSARGKNEYHFSVPEELPCHETCRCLYVPAFGGKDGVTPDMAEVHLVFEQLRRVKSGTIVVISSALIYGTGPGRQAFATEDYYAPGNGGKSICDKWTALEGLAQRFVSVDVRLTILRPVAVVPSPTVFGRLLSHKFVATMPGHDAVLQFLSLDDLAKAIELAFEHGKGGTFNVAPDGVTPLHAAVRISGNHRVAIPRTLQRLATNSEVLDYLRYSWTVSNDRAKSELDFRPAKSSTAALLALNGRNGNSDQTSTQFDDFGMDKNYIRFYGKTLFRFLSDYYWRIEDKGLEHVPRTGRGVLVGMHRGFMPWDGVMALHLLVKKTGRYPRFLTHPALLKFPFLANFMTKLGGVVASQQSANRVLENDELLGIFPEGIHGAFTKYREAYRLQEFGRDAFVKIALRNRAPIVPFVTVGSAEIFPILGKIKSRFWTRYTEWPYVPITPTFPLLPVPLPSKWHTQFLPAIHVEREHPPEAARNRAIVKAISLEVRNRMQQAVNEMLSRRRSIFFGSIFEAEAG